MWLNPLSKSIYNIAQNRNSKLSTNIPVNNPNNKHGTLNKQPPGGNLCLLILVGGWAHCFTILNYHN